MALPTLYIDTGGTSLGSGSTDTTNPTHSSTINSVTVSVSGTTVTFSGAIDLSAVPTDGSATIFINDATNSNQKIFKITGVNDGADTLTVDIAPTGSIATSTWGIGGRFVHAPSRWEGAQAPGWTFIFNNSPAGSSSDVITLRSAGSEVGPITIKGKAGTRPVINNTGTTQCIENSGTVNFCRIENLEFDQDGASGNVVNWTNASNTVYNCKWSDGGGIGCAISNASGDRIQVINCELTGITGDAIDNVDGAVGHVVMGCYIHDCSAIGINDNNSSTTGTLVYLIIFNVIDTLGAQGIDIAYGGTAPTSAHVIMHNTIYGCGDSGLQLRDDSAAATIRNNIFQDNGNAAGEFNFEGTAAEHLGVHDYNCFYHQGGGGGANLSGLTTNSTEITTDPLFINPAAGDFSLHAQSPCRMTGYPGAFLGGPTGYLDMGAVQGRHIINPTYNIGI